MNLMLADRKWSNVVLAARVIGRGAHDRPRSFSRA